MRQKIVAENKYFLLFFAEDVHESFILIAFVISSHKISDAEKYFRAKTK